MMSKSAALDLASSLGGSIAKGQVKSAAEQYVNYHHIYGGEAESRKSNYTDLVNKYYDLATSFYEYGWGDSFHFAGRWHEETFHESIKRHQHFIALQLGLKKGMKVLDVGCGIGGPLIEIARFSSTLVTGLNNNDYQMSRGKEIICAAGLSEQCNFVKGNFMEMPIADNTFDAAYALQATCHAPDAHNFSFHTGTVLLSMYLPPLVLQRGAYSEVYRVLKPGQYFALDEWCMTDRFDPNNGKHLSIKADIELGNGLPDIRTTHQCVQAMKDAGFEIIFAKDLAKDFPCPWYLPMDPSHFSWTSFQCTRPGRFITRAIINTLEFLHIAPAGSMGVYHFLQTASEGLLKGGREGIFTATFFVLGRKPIGETEIVNDGPRVSGIA
ncbi:cycloartenol-C-24-methyltransferase 1-like isoform X1 [Panicum virgatum]|uniref:cycloartenol-C-24-methyltransferase 1-like isoform X1 n=1 Tax=Panicum virgatum TaxID=38727 RepID=UPI0019D59655|nr:cycloartenol-C-24-methyltransferase 1-like isoform X1 [Panicum virgatum]